MARGYSDRINHAFAFMAKHVGSAGQDGGAVLWARASNIAVILSRYDCDEATIVAGILRHVVAEAKPRSRTSLELKIREKFGPVVAATIGEVLEHKDEDRAAERSWEARKRAYLDRLRGAEPRALSICAADEIHICGSWLADIRRLGIEYLPTLSGCTATQALWWYREMASLLDAHPEWPQRDMLEELRELAAELHRELGEP